MQGHEEVQSENDALKGKLLKVKKKCKEKDMEISELRSQVFVFECEKICYSWIVCISSW